MSAPPQPSSHDLIPIAETGERFSDFAPYVAAIGNDGLVAFQAALRAGGSGIFTGQGGSVATIASTAAGRFSRFYSHPALDGQGGCCFYAELTAGGQGLFLIRDEQLL